jgi:hypothetical protein
MNNSKKDYVVIPLTTPNKNKSRYLAKSKFNLIPFIYYTLTAEKVGDILFSAERESESNDRYIYIFNSNGNFIYYLGFKLDKLDASLKQGFNLYAQLFEVTEEIVDKCEEDYLKHSLIFSRTYYIYFTDKKIILD